MEQTFQLKGSLLTVTVVHLLNNDHRQIEQQVQQTVASAPKFFDYAPVLVDLSQMNQEIDLTTLQRIFLNNRLILKGIRGGNATQIQQAKNAHLAVFHSQSGPNNQHSMNIGATAQQTTNKDNNQYHTTKTVTHPVRSGKQIYAEGDLIVTAPVSPGAELLAEGNIHIYNTLRGRAFAGIEGNEQARIFCQSLKAELIAIAGFYRVNEHLDVPDHPNGLQVRLSQRTLIMDPL